MRVVAEQRVTRSIQKLYRRIKVLALRNSKLTATLQAWRDVVTTRLQQGDARLDAHDTKLAQHQAALVNHEARITALGG